MQEFINQNDLAGTLSIEKRELCTELKIEEQKKKKPEFCYKTGFPAMKKASISKR